ncbi:DUF3108 domain-containing protein [Lacihabitans sp. CCS-44]|uniref:DUF3108 domain-containing protein n=1 Tax=Lacihabitans sp. CCS-44 TaxID=2487331 RepID=UPI0020CF4522|nr:DUF3108 domain-containing protein [Lacihabitans sp. CCS-44]MCP9755099.1 DUF3108 domain-containing protein [Lacihabitans sp. CCS-44]
MLSFKYFILISLFCSFTFVEDFRTIQNDSFRAGESYDYKVKYGFLTIGEAQVDVDDKIYAVSNRPCFKVNVVGKTAGLTDVFKVRNTYRSYVDTLAFIPHKFIYSARENSYKRDQIINFDHHKNEAIKVEKEQSKTFAVPNNIQDVISGYYFLRTIDFSKFSIGQSISSPLFFDEDLYIMKIKYAGKGVIHTKFGKTRVLKLNPILPKNDLFKGENAIRIWVSDDRNRVPLKIEVDFSFGTIDMEIKNYKGVKYPFIWKVA